MTVMGLLLMISPLCSVLWILVTGVRDSGGGALRSLPIFLYEEYDISLFTRRLYNDLKLKLVNKLDDYG